MEMGCLRKMKFNFKKNCMTKKEARRMRRRRAKVFILQSKKRKCNLKNPKKKNVIFCF